MATAGFFGRLNYDYLEKYLLEVNLRYDGSSRFRSDSRWGFFPSASVGWNIAREKFFLPVSKVVNTFKVRASYGSWVTKIHLLYIRLILQSVQEQDHGSLTEH